MVIRLTRKKQQERLKHRNDSSLVLFDPTRPKGSDSDRLKVVSNDDWPSSEARSENVPCDLAYGGLESPKSRRRGRGEGRPKSLGREQICEIGGKGGGGRLRIFCAAGKSMQDQMTISEYEEDTLGESGSRQTSQYPSQPDQTSHSQSNLPLSLLRFAVIHFLPCIL